MPPAARLGDLSKCPADAHGCPACAHVVIGPIIQGSPNVTINGMPAARKTDMGIHAACCGPNMYNINQGSATVFINNLAAARLNDQTRHCGGMGNIIQGSPNVIIGDSGGGGGGGGKSTGGGVGTTQVVAADLGPSGSAPTLEEVKIKAAPDVTSKDGIEQKPIEEEAEKPEEPKALVNASWSQQRTTVGTEVELRAQVSNIPPGTSAEVQIRPRGSDEVVATLTTQVGEGGISVQWKPELQEGQPPEFEFTVVADGKESKAGILEVTDFVEFILRDADGNILPGYRYQLKFDDGSTRQGVSGEDGLVHEDDIYPGQCQVTLLFDEEEDEVEQEQAAPSGPAAVGQDVQSGGAGGTEQNTAQGSTEQAKAEDEKLK